MRPVNWHYFPVRYMRRCREQHTCAPMSRPAPASGTSPAHTGSTSHFAKPKTYKEIQLARERAIPVTTVADTKYCIGLFEERRKHRMDTTAANIPIITDMTKEEMQYWLVRFVLEVRTKCGDVYPPNSLHHIVAGVMKHV